MIYDDVFHDAARREISMTEPRKKLSIVVPAFNESGNVKTLSERVFSVLASYDYDVEIVFVDDGSSDGTSDVVRELRSHDERIKLIVLSRNFGHQIALTAGIDHAFGDAVVTMDADLQHPPEVIPVLIEKWISGFDIVNTVRKDSEDVSAIKKVTASLFYSLINKMSGVTILRGGADFRLLDRKAADALRQLRERDRFVRGLVPWIGFRQTAIEYQAATRLSGESKYPFRRMLRFAVDGIVSFSATPLRIGFYIGVLSALIALMYAIYAIVVFAIGKTIPGWLSIVGVSLFWGGILLIMQGVTAEYVGRIYSEIKHRPLYFVSSAHGIEKNESSASS